tara:strand:+ start:512 stop:1411 length:900 start_codon:yes stop_codon:yes gene_type:complete
MPSEGINFANNDKLFSIEELIRLSKIVVSQGINKIRITGGEPFVRKDLMVLLRELSVMNGLEDISITTNATLIGPYIDELKTLGIKNINVSMDAISKATFEKITRRNQYDVVYENIIRLITEGFNVRINFIALEGQNTDDIIPMLDLTKHYDVCVRFLEEMPFNGGSKSFNTIKWDYKRILEHIAEVYPNYYQLESPKTSTSINYKIPGFEGSFGLIPSFSRTFCGSCNRLRISATGDIITCLYAKASSNLLTALRETDTDEKVKEYIKKAIGSRVKTGFEAQEKYKDVFSNSMTSIGG